MWRHFDVVLCLNQNKKKNTKQTIIEYLQRINIKVKTGISESKHNEYITCYIRRLHVNIYIPFWNLYFLMNIKLDWLSKSMIN